MTPEQEARFNKIMGGGPREITHRITVEVLYPWLEEAGCNEDEITAIESQLQENLEMQMCFKDGCALLVHVDAVCLALPGLVNVDGGEPKHLNELLVRLHNQLRDSGVRYWLIGADTLPLEV